MKRAVARIKTIVLMRWNIFYEIVCYVFICFKGNLVTLPLLIPFLGSLLNGDRLEDCTMQRVYQLSFHTLFCEWV